MPGKKGWQLWHHFRGWLVVVADHRLVLPRIDAAGAAVNRADVDGERRRHGAGPVLVPVRASPVPGAGR